jgi:hypothetical protein
MKHKYSIEQVKEAIKTSLSYRQVMIKLGIKPEGGNYRIVKKLVAEHNIDISHFTGKAWNKGLKLEKRSLDDYLNNKAEIISHKLRLRLISEGVKEYKCESCGLSEWLGKPIALELNHIDGNHLNNNLGNLNILCPNCHAQTSNYRGLNKKS